MAQVPDISCSSTSSNAMAYTFPVCEEATNSADDDADSQGLRKDFSTSLPISSSPLTPLQPKLKRADATPEPQHAPRSRTSSVHNQSPSACDNDDNPIVCAVIDPPPQGPCGSGATASTTLGNVTTDCASGHSMSGTQVSALKRISVVTAPHSSGVNSPEDCLQRSLQELCGGSHDHLPDVPSRPTELDVASLAPSADVAAHNATTTPPLQPFGGSQFTSFSIQAHEVARGAWTFPSPPEATSGYQFPTETTPSSQPPLHPPSLNNNSMSHMSTAASASVSQQAIGQSPGSASQTTFPTAPANSSTLAKTLRKFTELRSGLFSVHRLRRKSFNQNSPPATVENSNSPVTSASSQMLLSTQNNPSAEEVIEFFLKDQTSPIETRLVQVMELAKELYEIAEEFESYYCSTTAPPASGLRPRSNSSQQGAPYVVLDTMMDSINGGQAYFAQMLEERQNPHPNVTIGPRRQSLGVPRFIQDGTSPVLNSFSALEFLTPSNRNNNQKTIFASGAPTFFNMNLFEQANANTLAEPYRPSSELSFVAHVNNSHLNRTTRAQFREDGGFEMINDYMILEELGRGVSGTVFLAVHQSSEDPFAIKSIAIPKARKGLIHRLSLSLDPSNDVSHNVLEGVPQCLSAESSAQSAAVLMGPRGDAVTVDGHGGKTGISTSGEFGGTVVSLNATGNGSQGCYPANAQAPSNGTLMMAECNASLNANSTKGLSNSCRGNSNAAGVQRNPVEREISIMKRLKHPSLIALHEVIDDEDEQQIHLVMDFCSRGPIIQIKGVHPLLTTTGASAQERQNSLPRGSSPSKHRTSGGIVVLETSVVRPVSKLATFAQQICSGLRYLHKLNIIHRDIKPDNILITADEQVKITDFGESALVAKLDEYGDAKKHRTVGTPAFFSPEICSGEQLGADFCSATGKESDVWAFGVTLYAALIGRLPFYGSNLDEQSRSILEDEVSFPLLHELPEPEPGLDEETYWYWKDAIRLMLRKNPKERLSLPDLSKHPALVGPSKAPREVMRRLRSHTLPAIELAPPNPDDPPPAPRARQSISKVREEMFGDYTMRVSAPSPSVGGSQQYDDIQSIVEGNTSVTTAVNCSATLPEHMLPSSEDVDCGSPKPLKPPVAPSSTVAIIAPTPPRECRPMELGRRRSSEAGKGGRMPQTAIATINILEDLVSDDETLSPDFAGKPQGLFSGGFPPTEARRGCPAQTEEHQDEIGGHDESSSSDDEEQLAILRSQIFADDGNDNSNVASTPRSMANRNAMRMVFVSHQKKRAILQRRTSSLGLSNQTLATRRGSLHSTAVADMQSVKLGANQMPTNH